MLIGQLAVDRSHQGRGLSGFLVLHALERMVLSADLTGGRVVIVNAIDQNAAQFWRGWGFEPSPSNPFQLLRSLEDVRASLAQSHR